MASVECGQSLREQSVTDAKTLDHADLVSQITDVIVAEGMVDREKLTPDATLESLDLKSIDIVMILTAIEEKFDVYIPMDGPFHEAKDVDGLIAAIASYIVKEKEKTV
jgi:acyl carrier protein